ncbi:VOC family protein [Caballeronia sp. AZ10_KS36]|uniref:VOC family protein n=1 Tax=Caballeronia sp. AZ10_KS36 TaxID=2921757 RepID=UPI0020293715|nr:VOC family protein [Caballeronia sp. AZ10_KS36]
MHKQIFVNLAVRDLKRSMTFFKALGLHFNPAFTNDAAACLVIGENIYAMLLTEAFFKTFTDKTLVDAHESVEALVCLSCESRAEVDELVAKAVAAGGRTPRAPQDNGSMYGHAFEDLDGHTWELVHMDPEAA